MANKTLFGSFMGALLPAADTRNEAAGPAYALSPQQALAQYAATGCLNATFYASAQQQLDTVLKLCGQVDAAMIARTAVYAREKGCMKDTPALLCAVLATKDVAVLDRVFDRVCDNGRMVRNFVQIVRSGVTGRKSLGSAPKRMVQRWLEQRSDEALLADSVGMNPSLADVIRLAHPKPKDDAREAFYAWLVGDPVDAAKLPEIVQAYEAFKRQPDRVPPKVAFQLLTNLTLSADQWRKIARDGGLQMVRMNLNTFARQGVFADASVAEAIAARLRDAREIRASRILPYQLMVAATNAGEGVPQSIRDALTDAMEIAIANVPAIEGRVAVCPDVSGSMQSAVTGVRKGATSGVRCVDVAALVASAFARRNPGAIVLPFTEKVLNVRLDPEAGVLANARTLAGLPPGGTNCSAPLKKLADEGERVDLVVLVSDNQSWVDTQPGATATMKQWSRIKAVNPAARLVCIDIQPGGTVQAKDRTDILNVGGFSDAVFGLVAEFAAGRMAPEHWTAVIEAVEI